MEVPADAVARAGIEKLSGGIPFVVKRLAASGGTPQRATHLTVSRTRLAALPPDALRLVKAAAIGDGHLRLNLLEQVTDLAGDELDLAIKSATMAGVLEEQPSHDELAFRHPLLREAVDESVGPGARRGWHRRWAEVLQANPGVLAAAPATIAVAQHWAGSGDTGKSLDAAASAAVAAEAGTRHARGRGRHVGPGPRVVGRRYGVAGIGAVQRAGDPPLPATCGRPGRQRAVPARSWTMTCGAPRTRPPGHAWNSR